MRPAHMAPYFVIRVILIKEMVFSLVIDQTIWIIGPIAGRTEMILRTKWFRVKSRVLSTGIYKKDNRQNKEHVFHNTHFRWLCYKSCRTKYAGTIAQAGFQDWDVYPVIENMTF